jgi:hypothetical protein
MKFNESGQNYCLAPFTIVKFPKISFNSVKEQKSFAEFDQTDLKISLNICCLWLIKQNGQKNLATFIINLTKILQQSPKDFFNSTLWSRPKFVSFNLIHEQNILLWVIVAVTYSALQHST